MKTILKIMNYDQIIKDEGSQELFTYAGLDCLIQRHKVLKVWVGYVFILRDHPLFGCGLYSRDSEAPNTSQDSIDITRAINVHNGVSHSRSEYKYAKSKRWVIGINFSHSDDIIPPWSDLCSPTATYKNKEFALAETKKLALALSLLESF